MSAIPNNITRAVFRSTAGGLMGSAAPRPVLMEDFDSVRRFGIIAPPVPDAHSRFYLRELEVGDANRLVELNQDIFFAPLRHIYGPIGFLNAAIKQQRAGRDRKDYFLGVVDKQSNELIGSVMFFDVKNVDAQLQAEIAYFIDPSYQNMKVATDATIKAISRLGSSLGIKALTATVHPGNKYSRQLLARLGFKQIGTEYISKYKEDPSRPESFDNEKALKFAPRVKYVVDYVHFLQQRSKVRTEPADVEKIEAARLLRQEVVLSRSMPPSRPNLPADRPAVNVPA